MSVDRYEAESIARSEAESACRNMQSDLEYYADRKAEEEARYVESRLRDSIEDLRRCLNEVSQELNELRANA